MAAGKQMIKRSRPRSRSRSGGKAVAFLVTFKGRFHTPALSGSVRRRKDRGLCTGLPVHQDVEEPPDSGELVEVEWEQCWASSVPQRGVQHNCISVTKMPFSILFMQQKLREKC